MEAAHPVEILEAARGVFAKDKAPGESPGEARTLLLIVDAHTVRVDTALDGIPLDSRQRAWARAVHLFYERGERGEAIFS